MDPCPSLKNNLEEIANHRETELATRATLIDGDFNKPVGILVPEGCAWRPVAESPGAFAYMPRDRESAFPGSMSALMPVMALPQ